MDLASHEPDADGGLIPVGSKRRAMELSLVLASQAIGVAIVSGADRRWALRVDSVDHDRALGVLAVYEKENRNWRWRQRVPGTRIVLHWGAVPLCMILGGVHALAARAPGLKNAWAFDTTSVLNGEWWRAFTAILLHADAGHLAANLATGLLLFGLAMGRLGVPAAILGFALSGALGNLASLCLHDHPYVGVGASGAVMGALGMLALRNLAAWRAGELAAREFYRAVAAGLFLFLLLGMDPASDVAAHAGGFAAGALWAAVLPRNCDEKFQSG